MQKKNVSGRASRVGGKENGSGDFNTWCEFRSSLAGKQYPDKIIALAEQVHGHCKYVYDVPGENISYTLTPALSFRVPCNFPDIKTVFSFMRIQKKAIKLYLSFMGNLPVAENIKVNPVDKKELIVDLREETEFTPAIRELIKKSWNIITEMQKGNTV